VKKAAPSPEDTTRIAAIRQRRVSFPRHGVGIP
jgi:hypothetical protein